MHFDAYRATIPAQPSMIEHIFKEEFGGYGTASPHKNYRHALTFAAVKARLNWGGHNLHPFVDVQGEWSHDVAQVIRSKFPQHRVSRADACIDFTGGRPEFKRLSSALVKVAEKWGVQTRLISSPSDHDKGQTLYLGSRSSEVMLRLYEKGKQLQEVKGITPPDANLLRFEIEVKPNKADRKRLLSRSAPEALAGFSRWSVQASSLVTGSVIPFAPRVSDRRTDAQKALEHMFQQYGGQASLFVRESGEKAFRSMMEAFIVRSIEDATQEKPENS